MLEVTGLTKRYPGGSAPALESVSFTGDAGEVVGILGPNGAGKSTLLRLLATSLQPTAGTAIIAGHDLRRDAAAIRARIGLMTSSTAAYGRLTARENLRYFAALHGLDRAAIDAAIARVAERFHLHDFLDRRADELSTGMRQRVGLARTVLHNPPVLILDEPTAGLDILAARDVLDFVVTARAEGRLILFSTHHAHEVARLCDRVVMIHRGRLLLDESLADFRARAAGGDIEEVFRRTLEAAP
jgi:sodium transport system ATP-binding protein